MENGQFIDGLPIKNGYFPWQTVSLPKGSYLPSMKHDGNIHHLAR